MLGAPGVSFRVCGDLRDCGRTAELGSPDCAGDARPQLSGKPTRCFLQKLGSSC